MSEGANIPPCPERDTREMGLETSGVAATVVARSKVKSPLRVVVVGEFNCGKTSLVNALAGAPVLPASFVTRTSHPTVLGFAARHSLSAETANRKRIRLCWDRLEDAPQDGIRRLHVGAPLERLRTLQLIDTPGLGFGDDDGDQRTLQLCRHANAVIWCTPAMQAWKASEERAWRTLSKRVRDRGILAVTFEDAIASPADIGRLIARLRAEAGPYFRRVVLASDRGTLAPQPPCEKDSPASRVRSVHAGMLEGIAAGPMR
jgi:50S ribosome-binding GTPase